MKLRKVPLWKVKRELRRVGRRLVRDVPLWFLAEWRYFLYRRFGRPPVVHEGQLPLGSRVAIFLIFPRDGVLRSHKAVLEYLISQGMAPVVVSNLPLADDDRRALLANCARLLERENFGYDFGGYQAGVLDIAAQVPGLDELIILNDSMWFPLGPNRNWIERARNSGAQFVGPIDATGSVERTELPDFRAVNWDWRRSRRNYHMSSFILWFGADLLRDPDFLKFWRKLRVTNDKTQTVRRGETGLSRFVRKKGYALAPIVDLATLPDVLEGLSPDQLREVLAGILVELPQGHERLLHEQLAAYDGGESWRQATVAMLLALATKRHMAYMSPLLVLRYLDGMFLKKALVPRTSATADVVVGLLRDYPDYFPADIAAEIETTIRRTHADP